MMDGVRRWFTRGETLPRWEEFAVWARERHWSHKRTSSHDGWAMTHNDDLPGWRIEWGPSQRAFMSAHEFRVRIDVGRWPDAQVLVLDRPLFARMDHEVYQQFTDSVQTRWDDQMPEEMRWLAMHSKLGGNELGVLRERYGAVAHDVAFAQRWLAGPLTEALKSRAEHLNADETSGESMMLRLFRGQVVIRQGAEKPTVAQLEGCVQVALAAQEACRREP